jgi:hypothetical protein
VGSIYQGRSYGTSLHCCAVCFLFHFRPLHSFLPDCALPHLRLNRLLSATLTNQASVEDHVLLEKLHSATSDKFKELSTSAGALNSEIATLQAKHKVRAMPTLAYVCGKLS